MFIAGNLCTELFLFCAVWPGLAFFAWWVAAAHHFFFKSASLLLSWASRLVKSWLEAPSSPPAPRVFELEVLRALAAAGFCTSVANLLWPVDAGASVLDI